MKNLISKLHSDEAGATSTEYIILLILIACFVIAIVKIFGQTLSSKFELANDEILKLEVNSAGAGAGAGAGAN